MGMKWGAFALDISAKWTILDEDIREALEDHSAPRKWGPLARPSDIVRRDARCRQLCRCVECEGPMPHHTPEMICHRCEAILLADLHRFEAAQPSQDPPHD